jgi:hypothetical protein
MVITYNDSTSKEWKIENMCSFRKLNKATKKISYPLPFSNEGFTL